MRRDEMFTRDRSNFHVLPRRIVESQIPTRGDITSRWCARWLLLRQSRSVNGQFESMYDWTRDVCSDPRRQALLRSLMLPGPVFGIRSVCACCAGQYEDLNDHDGLRQDVVYWFDSSGT